MTTMILPPSARIASTKSTDPQYDVLTAAVRKAVQVVCRCNDCRADGETAYIARGALVPGVAQAPSTTLLALAKRDLVMLDKIGGRIVGAWLTDLGGRVQREKAWRAAHAERTARIVRA